VGEELAVCKIAKEKAKPFYQTRKNATSDIARHRHSPKRYFPLFPRLPPEIRLRI